MHTLDILLSTYDGANHLEDQINSVINQDYASWSLLIRDDGSADSTVKIISDFAHKDGRITILEIDRKNIGPASSFMQMLAHSASDYFMFADQDDVWLPDKIKKTMAAMQDAEKRYGSSTPLLVHTDLKVVDEGLQPIADSFWNYQHLSPKLGSYLNRLLAKNVVTGCTVMINRALADLSTPIPDDATMHDWWLALVAATFGKVVYLDEQTILYRQHGKNSVGAKQWGVGRIMRQAQDAASARQSILRTVQQAQALFERFGGQMTPQQRDMVAAYSSLTAMSVPERLVSVYKYRFLMHGFARNVGFLLHLLTLHKAS